VSAITPTTQPKRSKGTGNPRPSGLARRKVVSVADVTAMRSAANDASSRVAGLWLSFLTFTAYLTMTIGSVDHVTLLRASPIKLPVLNVELPLVAFFWIAPFFFVLFHFYLLLQIVILVRKVAAYQDDLKRCFRSEEDQERDRKQLDTFLVVQFLFGSRDERLGTTHILLRSVAAISLVIAPVLLLLQFQLTFLPYHHSWVVWAQRLSILIDVRLSWIFWFAIRRGDGEIHFPELWFVSKLFRRVPSDKPLWHAIPALPSAIGNAFRQHRLAFLSAIFVVFASVFVVSYKGEPIGSLIELPYISDGDWERVSLSDFVLHGPINMVEGKPRRWFSNVLVVPNRKLVDDNKDNKKDSNVADGEVSGPYSALSLRGRDLRGAILVRSDMHNADFTGANLNEARLDFAVLSGARFGCQVPPSGRVRAAYSWPDDECTWLQAASLFQAELQSADFTDARMQGAVLISANLQGARMFNTDLQDALLSGAQLQGAWLSNAILRGAFLDDAVLIGAAMENVELQNAVLTGAVLDAVGLKGGTVVGSRGSPKIRLSDVVINKTPSPEKPHVTLDEPAIRKLRKEIIDGLSETDRKHYRDIDDKYADVGLTNWSEVEKQNEKESEEFELAQSLSREKAIEKYLESLACNLISRPYIARAIIENERVKAAKQYVGDFAKAITNADKCPGAQALSAQRRGQVDQFAQESSEIYMQVEDVPTSRTTTMTSSDSETREEQ
jgi:uncharacterized protein YjbI with pentapeptide repeats